MITITQIKAARGLLEWTQKELAEHSQVSLPTITNIERRLTQPNTNTLDKLKKTFEEHKIDFINGGVRLLDNMLNVRVLEGQNSLFTLFEDILETFKGKGGKSLISGVCEQDFEKYGGAQLYEWLDRFQKHGIEEYILLEEGDSHTLIDTQYYRWVSKDIFSHVPYFVYGHKYAIILWGPPQKIIIIENEQIAQTYRKQFHAHWKQGKPVS